jgi:hypothetical protein
LDSQALEAALAALPIPEGAARISAAHLVTELEDSETGHIIHIAMLSVGAHKQGQRRFDALGGAIALTPAGQEYVTHALGGTDIAYDAHDRTYDARFIVPDAERARRALRWLSARSAPEYFEGGPNREVFGELTGHELEGFMPAISREHPDWDAVRYRHLGIAIQPPPDDGTGTSVNAGKVPTRRLFHLWRMSVTADFFRQVREAEQIVSLSDVELASTAGGRRKGMLSDGTPLADNLGLSLVGSD